MMNELPIVLFILLIIAIMLRLDFIFYLIYVVAGVYILSRWWPGRSIRRLQLRRRFNDHAFLAEKIPVDIEVVNTGWLPVPWVRLDETSPTSLLVSNPLHQVMSLRSKERTVLSYELMGRQRGYYEIGPARISVGDLFGFAEVNAQVEARDHLTVYPRVIPLAQVDLTSHSPHGTIGSRQPIFADPARVSGVREYVPGDPMRSINWKSSARAQKLLVKKLEPAVSLSTLVALDLDREAYDRQQRYAHGEWAIVVAASLANYLVEQRQAVGLACNGRDTLTHAAQWAIPPRPGRAHLMKLLEWLARVEMVETTPLAEWLPTVVHDLPWGTVVVVITASGSEATCRSLHRLKRAGLNPVLVVAEPHGQFGIVRERARRLGFAAHQVANERDLTVWRTRSGPLAVGWVQ
jgi:uncharacterized protein (DUF58 family)